MQHTETAETLRNKPIYRGFPFATAETNTATPHKTARIEVANFGILTLTASHPDKAPEGMYTLSGILRLGDLIASDPYKTLRMAVRISDQGEQEPWFEAAPPDPAEGNEKTVVFDFVDAKNRDDQNRAQPKLLDLTDLPLLELKVSESRLIQPTP